MSHTPPPSMRKIGAPQGLSRHRSHGIPLRPSRSRPTLETFSKADDTMTFEPAVLKSSLGSDELKYIFHNMLFYYDFMLRCVKSHAPQGMDKHGESYRQAFKLVVTKVQKFPDDLFPSPACIAAQQSAVDAVDGFVRAARALRYGDPKLSALIANMDQRLRMSLAILVMLLQLTQHEIEEGLKRQRDCWNPKECITILTPEEEKAFAQDTKARPMSFFIQKATATPFCPIASTPAAAPRPRKSTLMNTIRKISGANLRRADSCAAIAPQPMLRSNCKGTMMLASLEGSLSIVPEPIRDTMYEFIVAGAVSVDSGLSVGAAHLEYTADDLLFRANIRGLVAVATSSCGAANQEYTAMLLMTFRYYSHAVSLAEALLLRYNEVAPRGLTQVQYCIWLEKMSRIKQRVVLVLHQWFARDWKPEDRPAIETLDLLIQKHIGPDSASDCDSLLRALHPCRKGSHHFGVRHLTPVCTSSPESPTSIGRHYLRHRVRSKSSDPWDITPFNSPDGIEEFARQLTLIDSAFYHRLKIEDWIELDRPEAVNIRKEWGEQHTLCLSDWVLDSTSGPSTPQERARGFNFWTLVAEKCASYHNFVSALTIFLIVKLNSTLTLTTQEISIKCIYAYRSLTELFKRPEGWWKVMAASNQSAIPVIGNICTWQMYIVESGAKHLRRREWTHGRELWKGLADNLGVIDVDGYLCVADIIWQLEYTYKPHNFTPIPAIQSWIKERCSQDRIMRNNTKLQEGTVRIEQQLSELGYEPSLMAHIDRAKHLRRRPMPLLPLPPLAPAPKPMPKKRKELVVAPPPLPSDAAVQIARARA